MVITDLVNKVLSETCEEIEKRCEVWFLEVGTDKNHVHFLIQSVPSCSVTKIVMMVRGEIPLPEPITFSTSWNSGLNIIHSSACLISEYNLGSGTGS